MTHPTTPATSPTTTAGAPAAPVGTNPGSTNVTEARTPLDHPVRVGIADDHESVRLGIQAACENVGYEVVATAATVKGLVDAINGRPCDVIVLDLSLGDGSLVTDHVHLAQSMGASVLVHSIADRVDRFLAGLVRDASAAERAKHQAATVVLDPPRSGAGHEVIDQLAVLSPKQILYVACDPVALARDVALLAGHGYELRKLRAFDLFPNTHHVEAVALLSK